MNDIEQVLHSQCRLGEGPLWHTGEQALYWVDIEARRLHRLVPASGAYDLFDIGLPVGLRVDVRGHEEPSFAGKESSRPGTGSRCGHDRL